MNDEKFIDVAMVTWPNHPMRLQYLEANIEAAREHLSASQHEIRFFCSIESEHDPDNVWCGLEAKQLCIRHEIRFKWRDKRANLGANMNAALRMCSAPTILLQQDDWRSVKPLDLSPGAELILSKPIDLLRYSWPDSDEMRPTFVERDGWRQIDVDGKWPYGDDPHLRKLGFMEKFGWYFEGGQHGSASGRLMRTLRRRRALIAASDMLYFRHFGHVSSVIDEKRAWKTPRPPSEGHLRKS
jgi:hypothetical protein